MFNGFRQQIGFMSTVSRSSIDTYNGAICDGSQDPWVFTGVGTDANKTPIHWEQGNADVSFTNILGKKQ